MRRVVTMDRLPGLVLVALVFLSLLLADHHVRHDVIAAPNPFVPVWVAYQRAGAIRLVGWVTCGVALAQMFPLRRPVNAAAFLVAARECVRPLTSWCLLASGLCLVLGLVSKGHYVLVAPHYLASQGPQALASLAGICMPLGLLCAGVVSSTRPWTGASVWIVLSLVLFASATRVFAGTVVLFLMGRLFAGIRVKSLTWLVGAASVFVLLPIPLICRGQPDNGHGLLPYALAVSHIDGAAYFDHLPELAAENLGFTVPLLQYVQRMPNITVHALMVQVDPRPAGMVGWNQLMPAMRVHYYIPYSMLGEFAHFGPAVLVAMCFLWCLTVRLCIHSAASNPTALMVVVLVVQMALAMLSVVQMTQYNTRSVARLMDIMCFGAFTDLATRRLQLHVVGLQAPAGLPLADGFDDGPSGR